MKGKIQHYVIPLLILTGLLVLSILPNYRPFAPLGYGFIGIISIFALVFYFQQKHCFSPIRSILLALGISAVLTIALMAISLLLTR